MDNNIFELKTSDSYGYDKKMYNFVCADEYTVTITLAEYRDLVATSSAAEARISDARRELYQLTDKYNELSDKYKEVREEYEKVKKERGVACEKSRD